MRCKQKEFDMSANFRLEVPSRTLRTRTATVTARLFPDTP